MQGLEIGAEAACAWRTGLGSVERRAKRKLFHRKEGPRGRWVNEDHLGLGCRV